MKNVRILSESEKTEIWEGLLDRIEKIEKVLDDIEQLDDDAANYLKRNFTKELPELKKLEKEILYAKKIQIES